MQQQVLATRLLHKDYLRRLEDVDKQAQAELAKNRATQRGDFERTGFTKADLQVFEQAKRDFESVYQRSLATAERLNIERSVVGREDSWITQVNESTLEVIEPVTPSNGIALPAVRAKVSALRSDIAKIKTAPLPADRARLEAWIDQRRRAAEGQIGQLIGRYPHFLTDDLDHGTMLALLTTLVPRDAMVDGLASRIDARADAVMSPKERPARLKELEDELTEWLRLDSLLVDKAIAEGLVDVHHDKESAAWITLGVAAVTNADARGETRLRFQG